MIHTTQLQSQEHEPINNGFRMAPAVISGSLVLLFFMSILYIVFSN